MFFVVAADIRIYLLLLLLLLPIQLVLSIGKLHLASIISVQSGENNLLSTLFGLLFSQLALQGAFRGGESSRLRLVDNCRLDGCEKAHISRCWRDANAQRCRPGPSASRKPSASQSHSSESSSSPTRRAGDAGLVFVVVV